MIKISVITVSFNSKDTIKSTIESVLGQKYPNIEYIIIDGRSTDGTLELINSYKTRISKVISEKDDGIYDAMNKGIKMSTGEVVGFINSDDVYSNEDVVGSIADIFSHQKVDSCYGDVQYVDRHDINKVIRHWHAKPFKKGMFKYGWYPPHPSFYVKKSILDKYGYFDLRFKISADYELILRLLEKYNIATTYLPKVIAKMRLGGESNKNIFNIWKANLECYKAWKVNGLKISIFQYLFKPIIKASQYIFK